VELTEKDLHQDPYSEVESTSNNTTQSNTTTTSNMTPQINSIPLSKPEANRNKTLTPIPQFRKLAQEISADIPKGPRESLAHSVKHSGMSR